MGPRDDLDGKRKSAVNQDQWARLIKCPVFFLARDELAMSSIDGRGH